MKTGTTFSTFAALLLFSVNAAHADTPRWCNGERAASFPHSTDVRADWLATTWDALPFGATLNWSKMQTQIDLHRRANGQLYRNQFTSETAPGADHATGAWICADANSTSPWFKEEGEVSIVFQKAMDGSFAIVPETFLVKKHETVFSWDISSSYALKPVESVSSAPALEARLLQSWDHVTLFQNQCNANLFEVIFERRRAVGDDTDVDHTIVLDFLATLAN